MTPTSGPTIILVEFPDHIAGSDVDVADLIRWQLPDALVNLRVGEDGRLQGYQLTMTFPDDAAATEAEAAIHRFADALGLRVCRQ